jgi:hypothetical protein
MTMPRTPHPVMPGLVPRTHASDEYEHDVEGRDQPGHDEQRR